MALAGPRHPWNSRFFDSSASVASKNFSNSSIALDGRRRMSCRSPSKGERSGTTKHPIIAFLFALRNLNHFEHADRFAFQHNAWIGRGIMNNEDIEGVTVLGPG